MTFQHDEISALYTVPRPTTIRMPMLGQETHLAALFILDDKLSVDVGTSPVPTHNSVILIVSSDDQRVSGESL